MSVVKELVDAIAADPRDEAPQLVIADYLQAEGDPRGELIILDRSERAGELDDPDALEQLLLLAAQYSFPYAGPAEPVLTFVLQNTYEPARYRLIHADRYYDLYVTEYSPELRICFMSNADDDDAWETHNFDEDPYGPKNLDMMLRVLSDVIHANTPFHCIKFPYENLPLPQYEGSPIRCYELPIPWLKQNSLLRNEVGLAARDYHRWHRIWNRARGMTRR